MELDALAPQAPLLAAAVALDLLLGDPVYRLHPVRLMGRSLERIEGWLRGWGWDGYAGGVALFLALGAFWGGLWSLLVMAAGWALHVLLVYSLIAMRDLLAHAWAVEQAARRGDLEGARTAVSRLVGRDTARMDLAACRRAAIESMAENLTDGWISPVAWYAVEGIPGIVLFKVASTMDSMVGYRTERYLKFGWCGARLDDLMNWLPARLAWLTIAGVAAVLPGYSGWRGLAVGWRQHAIAPGPNSGWSEATVAGAIRRRLIGPIWARGRLVTEVWLGLADDPAAGGEGDMRRAAVLVTASGLAWAGAVFGGLQY
jgi:adenosylcobinamide-phosphate synthase